MCYAIVTGYLNVSDNFFFNRTTVCKDNKMKCVQETVNRYVLFL